MRVEFIVTFRGKPTMKEKLGILLIIMLFSSIITISVSGQTIITKEHNNDILDNSPPNDPIIDAPDTVIKNRAFKMKFTTTDPDGDNIYYRYKLGEEGIPTPWGIPIPSGYTLIVRIRIIGYVGDLTVGCQAKDEHDAESGWSYHTITFTKVKSSSLVKSYPLCLLLRLFF